MKIGVIGGTGGMGKGFALRWCPKHDILIGSRDSQRASDAAKEYLELAVAHYDDICGTIAGYDNARVAQESDVLILSIPYENIDSVCSRVLPLTKDGCVVVSPIVPMVKTDAGFEFIPMIREEDPSHKMVARHARDSSRVVSAFHVISEKKLAKPGLRLDSDIFVCGDDREAVAVIEGLICEIDGLRPIRLGPGSLAYMVEIATPLLLNAMIRNKIRNPGIKIV